MLAEEDFERRRERLAEIGALIVGSQRYQRPLASMLGLSPSAVAQIVTHRIDLSADLEDRLGELAMEQAEQLTQRAMQLARLAVAIADDRRRGIGRLSKSTAQAVREDEELEAF